MTNKINSEIKKEEPISNLEIGNQEENKKIKRTPLYKQQAVGIESRPGFHRVQILEKPGRVERYLRAGYTPVRGRNQTLRDPRIQHRDGLGDVLIEVVNTHLEATAKTAIWLEIPIELYKEDQEYKRKRRLEREESWHPSAKAKAEPGVYIDPVLKDDKIN